VATVHLGAVVRDRQQQRDLGLVVFGAGVVEGGEALGELVSAFK
jgi:hypothetical protein